MSCLSVREPRHFQVSEREAMLVPLDAHGSVMSTSVGRKAWFLVSEREAMLVPLDANMEVSCLLLGRKAHPSVGQGNTRSGPLNLTVIEFTPSREGPDFRYPMPRMVSSLDATMEVYSLYRERLARLVSETRTDRIPVCGSCDYHSTLPQGRGPIPGLGHRGA